MKKIFTFALLLAVLFSAQFAAAQKTLYVYCKSGDLAAYPANKVTFDNDLFTFTYGDVTGVTDEMFTASFKVAFKSDDYKSFKQTPEVGICFSDLNEAPTIYDGKIKKGSSLDEYSFSIYSLDAGTTYYYRAYVKINDAVCYGDVNSITTLGKKPSYKIINGHKFVDLGLPNGLLWAVNNIGAGTSADDGEYFAWGETTPQSSNTYNWSFYKYGTSESNQTKYNSTDGKTVLGKEDDAAYVNWGSSCRMPTYDELGELLNSQNCTWTWTSKITSDGSSVNGYTVTSTKNGNSIFLPASGYRYNENLYIHGSHGYYWSSTLNSSDSGYAYYLNFSSGYLNQNYDFRCIGRTVRPVVDSSIEQNEKTAAQTVTAQQNMFVVDSNGEINAISVSSVDYATFNANEKLFTITNDSVQRTTNRLITAGCTVSLSAESNVKRLSITPEVGVCYSKYNSVPTIDDDCLSLGSELKSYFFTLKSLISGTTYYFRTYVKLASGVFYGDIVSAKTLGTAPVDKIIDGHKFIDLGLPSGLLWAETNIGAEKPADDGNYYAWGETTTKSTYTEISYFDSNYTIYSTSGKTTLEKQHDAANVNWGSSCRMPTDAEFDELLNSSNCTWTWTSQTTSTGSSINGYIVTSTKNGNSIFLPASGCRHREDLDNHGSDGYYWSSTLDSSNSCYARYLDFVSSSHDQLNDYRYYGRTVRPVAEP